MLNVSEGAEFFLTLCLLANHRVAYKKFGQRVRNVCETVFLTLVQEGAENAQGVLNSAGCRGC